MTASNNYYLKTTSNFLDVINKSQIEYYFSCRLSVNMMNIDNYLLILPSA